MILSIFLGGYGVDRFYLGDIKLGVLKLIFSWLTFGIWPLIDILFFPKMQTLNYNALMAIIEDNKKNVITVDAEPILQ